MAGPNAEEILMQNNTQEYWYYALDEQQHGPVSPQELSQLITQRRLEPQTLVWHSSFGDQWRPLSTVQDLLARQLLAQRTPKLAELHLANTPDAASQAPSSWRAAQSAWCYMRKVLFNPMLPQRWFGIGFCAWLAMLQTKMTLDKRSLNLTGISPENAATDGTQWLSTFITALAQNSREIIILLVVSFLFTLLLTGIRTRGEFMFVHRWYYPEATIKESWFLTRLPAFNLWLWRIALVLVSWVAMGGVLIAAWVILIKPFIASGQVWPLSVLRDSAILAIIGGAFFMLLGTLNLLTQTLLVPVMYWHDVKIWPAWRTVFTLCNQYPLRLLNFLFLHLACQMAAGLAVILLILGTCCLALIPLMVPYLGMVVILPILFFFRGYPIYFLNQWCADLIPQNME